MLALVPRFPEWFSRALVPGEHFIVVQPGGGGPMDFCNSIVALVRAREQHILLHKKN